MIIAPSNSSLNNFEIFTRVSGFPISSRKYTHNRNTILPELTFLSDCKKWAINLSIKYSKDKMDGTFAFLLFLNGA